MNRTIAITGTASGIGKATAAVLEQQGDRVIRISSSSGDVRADLSTPDGRKAMKEGVAKACGGRLDGIIACAGVSSPPRGEPVSMVKVNYFGALATLEGLRPLLAGSSAPRAVAVSSWGLLYERVPDLQEALLAGDEALAVRIAEKLELPSNLQNAYGTTKAALVRWVRRNCLAPEWLGAGILLNAIAPGVVETPMTKAIVENPELRAQLELGMPRPQGRDLQPEEVAQLLSWLVSPVNSGLCGQVIFIDGGSEVAVRKDTVW